MKKLLTLTVGAVMLFSLSACSRQQPSEQQSQSQSQSQQEEVKITRGVYNEDRTVFTNDSTGMRIELPEGWYACTDDEVAAALMPSVTGGELAEWGEEEFKREKVIPDTIITDPDTNYNLVIQYENLAAENAAHVTDEFYMENIKSQLEKTGQDYTYEEMDDLVLSGKTYHALKASTEVNGVVVEQIMRFSRHGDYMICVVYTSLGENSEQQLKEFFK